MVVAHISSTSRSTLAAPIDPALVLAVFERGKDDTFAFNATLQREVDRVTDQLVLPLVQSAWPTLVEAGFMRKLRPCVGAYVHLALSVIACSRHRPPAFRMLSKTVRGLGLSPKTLGTLVSLGLPVAFRVVERERVQRAALAAALIIVFAEALDATDVAVDGRARAVMDVMLGKVPASTDRLRAVRAVMQAVERRCSNDADRARLATTIGYYEAWAHAEERNLLGIEDPTGMCHRREAMVASMDGLCWAVSPYAGPKEWQWVIDIAESAQMVDDVLDMEKDAREGRITPALTGRWNVETIRSGFAEVERVLLEGLAEAGDVDGAYPDMCLRVCRSQCYEATRILIQNP